MIKSIRRSLLGVCACICSYAAAEGQYDGVTIAILTRPGPVIAQRLAERGAEFEAITGASIVVNEVPQAEIFQKLLTDWATGTNSIDVGVFLSGWGVELVNAGLVENLDPYIAKDQLIDLNDITPYFREFNQRIGGNTYLITIDGDFQMLYYRRDILEEAGLEPPRTWQDYLEVAAAVNGKDMNGDGQSDYGSCIFKKRNSQSFATVGSIAASFNQTQGTAQGFWFDQETMKPLINNDGWARAFEIYKATGKYGPPDELNQDIGDTRALVTSGRCALAIDWGDIGPLSIDPGGEAIRDRIGAVIMPGTREVVDHATGKLVQCDNKKCPYAAEGINHAPYAAFGGWVGAVNAASDDIVKHAAYDFLSYMSQAAQSNVDVTMGWTGYNPYRNSQLNDASNWVKAGFSPEFAENYLGAISDSLNHPNMASDIRLPGAHQYTKVLDRELARFLADEITAAQALSNIEAAWEEITEDFGRDEQRAMYRLGLGTLN